MANVSFHVSLPRVLIWGDPEPTEACVALDWEVPASDIRLSINKTRKSLEAVSSSCLELLRSHKGKAELLPFESWSLTSDFRDLSSDSLSNMPMYLIKNIDFLL